MLFMLFALILPLVVHTLVVVEYGGTFPMMPYKTRAEALKEMSVNLQSYRDMAASNHHSSVVVFPEYGLYSPNFDTKDSILPYLEVLPNVGSSVACGNDSTLAMVSCLAAALNATVVVNMGELVWTTDDKSQRKQFNVNVAVTPSGVLLAKYRKQHLYYEPAFDSGEGEYSTHPSVFTDPASNVTYGLLICNDLTYQATMQSLAALVDVVIGPSWWVNLPPLMSGTAYYSSLSLSYNTTLAVAGCGMGWYCSGSGIYSRGRALGNFFNPEYVKESMMVEADDSLTAKTAVVASTETRSGALVKPPFLSFLRADAESNSTIYRFAPPAVGESFTHTVISARGLQCTVAGTIAALSADPVSLAVVAIRGLAPDLGFPQWEIEYCGVVACPADDCLSTLVLASNTTLASVKVEANFNLAKFRLFPILLESDAMVLEDSAAACEVIDLTERGALTCSRVSNASPATVGTLSLSLLGIEVQ